MRASTENVGGIIAFGRAAAISSAKLEELEKKSKEIFGHIRDKLQQIKDVLFITSTEESAPHILTFALPKVKGEVMLHALESKNIFVGTGSACTSKKKTNRLKNAIGLPDSYSENVIRLSISTNNTLREAEVVADAIIEEYNNLSLYTRG